MNKNDKIEKHELYNFTKDDKIVDALFISFLKSQEKEYQTDNFSIKSKGFKQVLIDQQKFIASYIGTKDKDIIIEVLSSALKNMKQEMGDIIISSKGIISPSDWLVHEFVKLELKEYKKNNMLDFL